MSGANDRTSLLGGHRGPGGQGAAGGATPSDEAGPVYYDTQQSASTRIFQFAFMLIVVLLVLISVILSIYRSAATHNGFFVMLGLSLVGLLALEILLIVFIRNGDLAPERSWFLYVVGAAIALESIFTNVLLFA